MRKPLTGFDLLQFRDLHFGDRRGSIKAICKVFGMNEGTFFGIRKAPEKDLQSWYATTLAFYKATPSEILYQTWLNEFGVDVREFRSKR
jgi:hypothetical protein